MLPEESLNLSSDWSCDNCEAKVNHATMVAIFDELEVDVENFKEIDIKVIEEKLAQLLTGKSGHFHKFLWFLLLYILVLHPKHYYALTIKKRLLDVLVLVLKKEDPEDETVLRPMLERIMELGTELLEVEEKIEVGYSLKRGRLLRQMHLPGMKLAKMDLKVRIIQD